MEPISETTIDQNLTSGSAKRLRHKINVMKQHSPLESDLFRRFLKAPLIISNLLFLTLFFAFVKVGILIASDGWYGYFTITVYTVCGYVFSASIKGMANTIMSRKRLWLWGKDKFNSWGEFTEWMKLTPAEEMDYLASLPDEAWEPDYKKGGGIDIIDWDKET